MSLFLSFFSEAELYWIMAHIQKKGNNLKLIYKNMPSQSNQLYLKISNANSAYT